MPTNFDESVFDTFLRVPTEALPRGVTTGRFNYTVTPSPSSKCRIEVHLSDKRFHVKAESDGKRPEIPGVKWAVAGNIEQAWQVAKSKAKW
eukprot:10261658-Alexandrium_andersonii.AAC.1